MRVSSTSRCVKDAPLVALTTDFGLDDVYVGVMKGVILGVCPEACILDLTHGIPPQDVLAGCLALEAARPFLPHGTIHAAVVDPGVGTGRAAIAVRTERDAFVGPDNGLFSFLEPGEIREARYLENPDLWLHPISATFHGRDVFAPVAAHLARGLPWQELGPSAPEIYRIPLPRPTPGPEGLTGQVLTFDRFGNAITNLRTADLSPELRRVQVAGREFPVGATYGHVAPGQPVALVGSSGRLELAVREGNARLTLGLSRGSPVVLGP